MKLRLTRKGNAIVRRISSQTLNLRVCGSLAALGGEHPVGGFFNSS
jgi:hypothetical protein